MTKERKTYPNEIAEKLGQALMSKGFNMKEASLKSGLGETVVRDIITGRIQSPRQSTLAQIAKALEMPVSHLVPGTGLSDYGPSYGDAPRVPNKDVYDTIRKELIKLSRKPKSGLKEHDVDSAAWDLFSEIHTDLSLDSTDKQLGAASFAVKQFEKELKGD